MSASDLTSVRVTGSQPKRQTGSLTRNRMMWGLLFLTPWLIGFVAFQLLPILATVFLSFTDYSATKEFAPGNFNMVGLSNYARLFSDADLLHSMGVTLKF